RLGCGACCLQSDEEAIRQAAMRKEWNNAAKCIIGKKQTELPTPTQSAAPRLKRTFGALIWRIGPPILHSLSSELHRSSSELRRSSSELRRSSSELHRSSSELHRSSSELHRSSSELHRSSSELRRSSSELRRSSSELRRSSSELHQWSSRFRRPSRTRLIPSVRYRLMEFCSPMMEFGASFSIRAGF